MTIFDPPLDIFTIVGGIVLGLCLLELVLFFIGASISKIFSHDFDLDHDLAHDIDIDHDVNLFHFNEVPFIVIMLSLGTFFTASGFGLHLLGQNLGMTFSNLAVIPASIFTSSFMTYLITTAFSKIAPNNETYAIKLEDLLGQPGKVVIGTGTYTDSVQISVNDKFGSTHYIMTKAAIDGQVLRQGDKIVLIEKYPNGTYGSILSEEVEQEQEI